MRHKQCSGAPWFLADGQQPIEQVMEVLRQAIAEIPAQVRTASEFQEQMLEAADVLLDEEMGSR